MADRKAELNKKIDELQKRRSVIVDERSKHTASRDANQRELVALQQRRESETENEALYNRSDIASIDAKLKATSDRLRGFERLCAAKTDEIKILDDQLAPLEGELRNMAVAEEVNKQVGEIAEIERVAMVDVAAREAIAVRLTDVERGLRARNFHPAVTSAATSAAERIGRAFHGMRP